MKINTKLNSRGFTIVETLIVLAIAAIIIIIVLLAVPALQRTTRNTDIKNDAAAIAAAINDFESNNGGSLPTGVAKKSGAANTVYLCSVTNGACSTATPGSTATIQPGDNICAASTLPAATNGTAPSWFSASHAVACPAVGGVSPFGYMTVNYIMVVLKATCFSTTANNAGQTLTYSGNQAAVLYPDETGGVGNVECLQA